MKRIFTLLILGLLLSVATTDVEAQIVKGEAFAGFNLSQVDGDEAFGFKKLGLHAGLGVLVPVYQKNNFNIDFSLEVTFNQKGAHQRQIYSGANDGITGEYDLYLNYLEVPVLIYFTDKQITSFGIGFSYGMLRSMKEYEHGNITDVNLNYTGVDKYDMDDYCVLADLKFRIHERFKLGIRYQYSIDKIRTRPFYNSNGGPSCPRDQYNNVITARLIYIFNEDRSQYLYDEYEFHGDNPRIHQKTIDKKLKKLRKQEEKAAKKKNR